MMQRKLTQAYYSQISENHRQNLEGIQKRKKDHYIQGNNNINDS